MSRNRQPSGSFRQSVESSEMQALAVVAQLSRRLVRKEQERCGGCADTALKTVARRMRAAPGAFANLIRMRVNKVCADLRDRIVKAALADIEQEIERLDHDKRLLESLGFGPSHNDVRAVEDAIASARAALARMKGSRS